MTIAPIRSHFLGRNFLKELDFTSDELVELIDLAADLKAAKRSGAEPRRLTGKNIALIFEKASTRTRCAFEVAAYDQGAHVTYLGPEGSHLGKKETIKDTARVLGRMYDGIEYRGFDQERVETLGRFAGVPVWNGLTDQWHPTQMLADMLTMREHANKPLAEISFCYLGDARNNTARSLFVTGALLGMDARIAAPSTLRPDDELRTTAEKISVESGARLLVTSDIATAVDGVDFLYTDVWVSMGEPTDTWSERIGLLLPYQVNQSVVALTGNPEVRFMHCLPAFHNHETAIGDDLYRNTAIDGLEVTEEVFESPRSIVFDQAENRMHTIKAVLVATLAG